MRALMPLATLVCLAAALPLLDPLVRGGTWWVPALVLMAVSAGVSALYRYTGRNPAPIPLLQALAVFLLLIPAFASHAAPWGLFPTEGSTRYLLHLFERGVGDINGGTVPVAASAGVVFIVALSFAVLVIVADFLAVTAECAGMVGALLLALMAVPLLVDPGGLGPGQFLWCGTGFVLLLVVDTWVGRRAWGMPVPFPAGGRISGWLRGAGAAVLAAATALVAGTAAVLVAATLASAVPSLRTDAFYDLAGGGGAGFGEDMVTTSHPLVSMRRDLASSAEETVLTYRTDAEEPDYLRTHVLERFDGENWTMEPVDATADNVADGQLPLPAGWGSELPGGDETTRMSLDPSAPRQEFLPLPYWARSVDVDGQWHVDEGSHMVFATDTPSSGLDYTVRSSAPSPTAEDLAEAGAPSSLPVGHLDLPRGIDPQVRELTDSVTESAGSAHERALAIQDHFTDFDYDLRPPEVPEDSDPLAHFLFEDRVGYCEQFAGAMALMARQADIPARVAVGYTQGERSGGDRWEVTSGDAHAWPELFFEGAGWVRFEPTPSSGDGQGSASVPEHAASASRQGTETEEEPPSPSPTPSPEEGASEDEPEDDPADGQEDSSPGADEESGAGGAADGGSGASGGPGLSWLPQAALVSALLLAALLPWLVRTALRASRFAAAGGAPAPAAHAAWREVRDTCLDLGLGWDLSQTPRAAATRLDPASGALWRLALAEEAARYAPEPVGGGQLREDLREVRSSLAACVDRPAQLRALVLPRSLVSRGRFPAEPSARGRGAPEEGTAAGLAG